MRKTLLLVALLTIGCADDNGTAPGSGGGNTADGALSRNDGAADSGQADAGATSDAADVLIDDPLNSADPSHGMGPGPLDHPTEGTAHECSTCPLDPPDAEDIEQTDAGTEDSGGPDTTEPDTTEPDTNEPDTNEPDTNIPDTNIPDTNVPDTNVPDANIPDTNTPDTGSGSTDVAELDTFDDADSGDTDIAEADANGPDAAHSGTTDVQFGTADIAANPEDPADPQPMDEPSTCEDPPAAPYVQVDNTKKFKVTYHPVPASDDGRALLKTLCSESPPGCDDGKACTRLRFYKPIPLWYAMKIDQDCDQPDAPKITWSVKDAYLRGPPKTKHTVKDFHKAGETVYEGTTNIWKASDAQLAKIKEYLENRHPFNAGLAEMRYKAIAKMQAHLVWHEEQHEAIDIAFLKAQVAIYNDTKWPATVTTAEGSTISDAKKAVLKAISADRVQREKQAFARTKKCHDDFHVEEFKAAAYYTLVTKCVCGTKETNLADTPNTLAICDKLFEAATKPPSAAFTCADPP